MQSIAFAWKLLLARKAASGLNALLLALGLAAAGVVALAQHQIDRAFDRDLRGIDAVVGAKGSPMQLILSSVLHLDVPAGNVKLADVNQLSSHKQVKAVIPISLGDNLSGHRIVGTSLAYPALYGATPATGRLFGKPMEATLGAQVAANTGLTVGQQFAGSHGLGAGGELHAKAPFTVVGVLAACGCVLDGLVLTATESVWQVHDAEHATDAKDLAAIQAAMLDEREVTAAIVQYNTPLAAVGFPRFVNQRTNLQAAAPALEISRLLRMLGAGTAVLKGFAWVLLLVAALSVWMALHAGLRERRADWAALRLLGASPLRLVGVLAAQSLLLALVASALAVPLALAAHAGAAQLAQSSGVLSAQAAPGAPGLGGLTLALQLWWLPLVATGVALLATLAPAWGLYRVDAAELLASRRI
jgi:putative ABC transport system permease protein